MKSRRSTAGWLLLAAVVCTAVNTLWPQLTNSWAGLLTWSAGFLLWSELPTHTRRQIVILISIGSMGLLWGLTQHLTPDWAMMLSGNAQLLSMLAAVSFLRLITRPDNNPERVMPQGKRAVWSTLFGVHLFGAVINLSSVFIMGDRLRGKTGLDREQIIVLTRGFSAAAFWSPFFAAMAAAMTYAPGARLERIWLMGMPLAIIALMITGYSRRQPREFVGYPMHPSALALPAVLALAILLIHQLRPEWHILGIICLLSPMLALIVVSARRQQPLLQLQRHITHDIPTMHNELCLFLAANVMAAGLNALFQGFGGWMPFSQFGGLEASMTLLFMLITSIVGVHPVINIAALGTLLAPLQPDGTLLAMTFLSAWAVGVTCSPFSGINLSMQGRYGQHSLASLKWHGNYSLVMFFCSLAALNLYAALWL
ncbi:MAG: hypothetical protein DBP02_03790 [gamma proteobacterium symbiont of Ctena orbiculata]|nr:MAG: hypothetical protein DBP02_03790 [gamma proteobacterium symbiont of Ctena orbiculata]PUB86181.1 MAG: hypothetical protein DBP01_13885 [gamma proteobacterium symbiont of Ctena orbiculata]